MKLERSNINFPLWRKKVDATIFKYASTPIPKWVCKMWDINSIFPTSISKRDSQCNVKIYFKKKSYQGSVVCSLPNNMYRLFFDNELRDTLKDVFLMSYMRSIEEDIRKGRKEYLNKEIEEEIPFWEFIDIEFDSKSKIFYFKAYYTQKPAYIELFKELVKSHTLKLIDVTINTKEEFRFIKQDWKPREELKRQIDAKNVIYNLIDTKNKVIYIGEAESLIQRMNQKRVAIMDWDYYRFDCLPEGLNKTQRVAIERLLIRTFASFFNNSKNIPTMCVSEYKLANEKIDH